MTERENRAVNFLYVIVRKVHLRENKKCRNKRNFGETNKTMEKENKEKKRSETRRSWRK